jgi:uncharacterized protein (UPF0276 family)
VGQVPDLGHGVGLRREHFERVLAAPTRVDWFEVVSENFMIEGGRPLHVLERVRRDHPLVLHGVSLSIGSTDPLDSDYLERLGRLAVRIQPAWISDHLCWTGVGGHNAHDLLPLPYTEEALAHVVARVGAVQERLGRRIALENVSSYLEFAGSTLPEWEFPAERVWQVHLAGHSDRGSHLLDTHSCRVADAVWELYAFATRRIGAVASLVEWDEAVPDWDTLEAESLQARQVRQRALAAPA